MKDPGTMELTSNYPESPYLEPVTQRLEVFFNGQKIADTCRGYRILEKNQPPVYYFPPEDIRMEFLVPVHRATFCERKGTASYFTIRVKNREAQLAAWSFSGPDAVFQEIKSYISFYPSLMDECRVNGEIVVGHPGKFCGGWITKNIKD